MQNHLLNQQNLANQSAIGQIGASQALGLGGASGGGGGLFGTYSPVPRYVSTMEMMENDVADWLLDWDK